MKQQQVAIKDFRHLRGYSSLIEKRIKTDLWQMIYAPLFKILHIKRAKNDTNAIIEAIESGEIVYTGEGFEIQGKISNRLYHELIEIGARYDKSTKTFLIARDNLPHSISNYITNSLIRAQQRLNIINAFLGDVETNLDQMIETILFTTEIQTILDDVGNQVKKNVRNINVVVPELTEKQMQQIASDYTYNMQYYIKKWASGSIPEMRQKVQRAILEGYREDQVQEMIEKEYPKMAYKAKFLARNETAIMLSTLKKSMYSEMGFTEFVWQTILDGRERLLHKKLNGKVFSFDNPPVIDERTGQKGLPGQTYNCRCNLIPIRRSNILVEPTQLKNYKDVMKYGPNE